MLVISRAPDEGVVIDGRILVVLHAVGARSVYVKVNVDGGPTATAELRTPRRRGGPIDWFPLAPGVRVGVSDRTGFMVRLAFEAPPAMRIRREELLTREEYAAAIAPRRAQAGAA